MTRYRALLAYDGTAYQGFQRQAGGTPTVQGALEAALARLGGQQVTVHAAGRTDAGVHASGQVIAFDLDWRHEAGALLRALNANLPTDIALQNIAEAAAGFHPRFSALGRRYVYELYARRVRQPLWDRWRWHVPFPLDAGAMQAAAALLPGEHDFATFGQPTQGESTTRRVTESVLTVAAAGDVLAYCISGNAFLQHMVRSIVGTLVEVGRGAMAVDEFAAAFHAADRGRAGPTAPPHGLILVEVIYEAEFTGSAFTPPA